MAGKQTIECLVCGKEESFADLKDIIQSHWQVLGWDVGNNSPKCVCNKCEYKVAKITKTPVEETK